MLLKDLMGHEIDCEFGDPKELDNIRLSSCQMCEQRFDDDSDEEVKEN